MSLQITMLTGRKNLSRYRKKRIILSLNNFLCRNFLLKKQKTCTVFLLSSRNTSGSLGEQEMLWEHKPQASVSTAFQSSPKLSRVFLKLNRNMDQIFSISFRKQLVNFDYQNVNPRCSHHHYVNSARQFCVSIELYMQQLTRFLTNQCACFLRTVF